MRIYYDLHLHTALSPCGDKEMTPNNVVNMAGILGFQCIAITDHNSMDNVAACMEVAKETGLIVIPGMEVETQEEIHVICLFPTLEDGMAFAAVVAARRSHRPNNEAIFGEQLRMNALDEVTGKETDLLITATTIDIYELVHLVKEHNGVAIPAHIDRASYSIISNLGFIPNDLKIPVVEFSKDADPLAQQQQLEKYHHRIYPFIVSSDAHYLEHMMEPQCYMEFEEMPTAAEIVERLKKGMV